MTFKEYRDNCSHQATFILQIHKGKNITKETYSYADFDEDEEYVLDDYTVTVQDVNYGFDKHWLKLTR